MVAVSASSYPGAPSVPSRADRITGHQRRLMARAFVAATCAGRSDTILDVGAIGDRAEGRDSHFAASCPHNGRITALAFDDTPLTEDRARNAQLVGAEGCAFPFEDGTFDYVHSAAVLEHVGRREHQAEFLRQAWRVARKGIFIATANRWFPVEFHTGLPLLHWLPPALFRWTLRGLGKRAFALEQNFNLLCASDLSSLARTAGIRGAEIWKVSLFLWPTDLMLVALKR